MTIQHLNVAHRILKRQAPAVPPVGGAHTTSGATGSGAPSPSSSDGPDPANGPVFTSASATTSPPPRPTNSPPSSQAPPPPATTTSQSSAAVTTSSSTTSTSDTTTTSSSASTSSTTIAIPTTSLRGTTFIPGTTLVAASSFGTVPQITSLGPTSTPSSSSTPAPTSGVSVGKIVGGIAGGLVGVAILGFLVSFILRRLRKRSRRNTFTDDDFRQSRFISDNNDPPLSAPNMAQRTHNITPSIGSGPGMAGQGAYQQSNTAMYAGDDAYNASAPAAAGYGGAGYGAPGYGAPAAAGMGAAAGGALHERPRYTYGQNNNNDDEASEIAHGAYSSQPQVQAPYNPEAYGSYAAYGGAPAGYQEATREYQAPHPQQGGYAQGGYHDQQQYGDGHYGVAVADPGPATATHVGAHSTSPSPRDPVSMNGTRGPNTRSVVQDDDVYGGI